MDSGATMKCPFFAGRLLCASLVSAQTDELLGGMRLLARQFSDCTILPAAGPDEPWRASWNDPGQMATFENPTSNVVITSQYLKFSGRHGAERSRRQPRCGPRR